MRNWITASLILALVLAIGLSPISAGETYKQNEDGLAKEFDAFLKAYHKGDDAGMEQAFSAFRIPNANDWFAQHFSAEDAARLNSAYPRKVTDGMNALIDDMNRAGPGNKYSIHCEPRGDVPAGKTDAAQPVKPVRVEQFLLQFQALGTREKFLFIANFVYVDGAYRFVGGGGAPFWGKSQEDK